LDSVRPRLVITETEVTWTCLANPAYARWAMGWGVGFIVVAGGAFSTFAWLLVSVTPLMGLGVAAMILVWLLLGILGSALFFVWRSRETPPVADGPKGTLSYGRALLCRLDEIREMAPRDDKSVDEPSFSLIVCLKDGRSVVLPWSFVALPLDEAQSACASFGSFLGRTRGREPACPEVEAGDSGR